jgi:hypothetical protein
MICRYQSRANREAKRAKTTIPSTDNRKRGESAFIA